MTADLFIRSLRGAGLEHDVDLFLQRFHRGGGRFPLVIFADSPDDAMSSEAMIPALRYLSRERIGVLLLSRGTETGQEASFAARLQALGLFADSRTLASPQDWRAVAEGPQGSIVGARLPEPAAWDATALVSSLHALGCRKIVLLDAQGIACLRDAPSSIVTVPADEMAAETLAQVDAKQRSIVALAAALARPAEDLDITVSLASPINLLAELFTVRGSGTLFRPPARFESFETPDRREAALADVIEQAFGRTLRDRAFASARGARVILDSHLRAAAVLMPTPLGDYMSKFAVVREAQGTGLGAELWAEVVQAAPRLFWRSKNGNPINSWYARVADGMIRQPPWTYFWRGLNFAEAEAACYFAAKLTEDFVQEPGENTGEKRWPSVLDSH